MNILILCAGFGTRLKPLTNDLPKPLVPILGEPVLAHHLKACEHLSYDNLCINTHHLADQVHAWIKGKPIDKVFHEPEILGTGGPLHRLYREGMHDDLLVINSDIFHNINLGSFVEQSKNSTALFSVMCVDDPNVNTLQLNEQHRVTSVQNTYSVGTACRHRTYAGIAWYSAQALSHINQEHRNVIRYWHDRAEARDLPLAVETEPGAYWFDIGTPTGLYKANFKLLEEKGLPSFEAEPLRQGKVSHCILGKQVTLNPACVLHRCLVLDHAQIMSSTQLRNAVIGRNLVWPIDLN